MGNDRAHFETYREQTHVKHLILERYLPVFYRILKRNNTELAYIDGFAGRGFYTDANGKRYPGSPIRALRTIIRGEYAPKVRVAFIEPDPELFSQLKSEISKLNPELTQLKALRLWNDRFDVEMNGLLDRLAGHGATLPPTFLFVDPCGVSGTCFQTIQRVLTYKSTEAFIFFNVDAVRRIVGLGESIGGTLPELLGTRERAMALLHRFNEAKTTYSREDALVSFYFDLLRSETNAKYVTGFRVEAENRRTTSHYLIHATSHPLGFSIMKDVMWGVGETRYGPGGLELEQKSINDNWMLFQRPMDVLVEHVRDHLRTGCKRVSYFYRHLAQQPDNVYCEAAYRAALLRLEAQGNLRVSAKDGSGAPVKRKAGTLAKDYYAELTS